MIFNRTKINDDNESCLSKIKSFIKQHPFIFYGIIAGTIVLITIITVLCVVLTKDKDEKKEEENKEEEEIKIFPLEEKSKSEVMNIYNNIGNNDQGTLEQFCEYLSEQASNLKEDQKVYLAYYWIINNIKYDYDSYHSGDISNAANPNYVFLNRKGVCSGYSRLFRILLLSMNYTESKIKNIIGYSRGGGSYSPFKEPEIDHEWNAVEINGNWCLIDTTWDAGKTTEDHLCTPPKCFVRDHLPGFNDDEQFLENPITLEKFT